MSVSHADVQQIGELVRQHIEHFERLLTEIRKVIVGQEDLLRKMLVGLLADGHILLEGVPGLAKTTAVASLARGLRTSFQRIQFTPDLLPADIIGTQIFQPHDGSFTVKKGPIFANIVLADEINRAPAKVQSALLEAMQERQVTIGQQTFPLDAPFMVLATQNPIEQEGTYPLPEAQVDRFMLKLIVEYPSAAEERVILDRMGPQRGIPAVSEVLEPQRIFEARKLLDDIYIDDKVKDYIVSLVHATRRPGRIRKLDIAEWIEYGASPRATIYLALRCQVRWRFLEWPRLRHAPGRQGHRSRHPASPRDRQLRGRGGRENQRRRRRARAEPHPGSLTPRHRRNRFWAY